MKLKRLMCLALPAALSLWAAAAVSGAAAAELRPWTGGATPPLVLRDLQGKEHRLEDYRGKVVVLNYWATWCDPCREEMPSMQRLHDRLKGRPFEILAVDYGEGAPRINDFLKKLPVRFTVLMDRDLSTAGAWKVRVLPTSLVIGPDGKIRYSVVGDAEWDSPAVEGTIRRLLP